jgi:ankyrin repeat protein
MEIEEIYKQVAANTNLLPGICLELTDQEIRKIIEHEAFPKLVDEYDENIFIILAKSKRYKLLLDNIQTLMKAPNLFNVWFHKNKMSNTTGHYLISQTNDVTWLTKLIDICPDYIMLQNNALNSILHVMISQHHPKTIKILKLIPLKQLEQYKQPLIMACVVFDNFEVMEYLHNIGYNLHTCTINGTTPLELAMTSKKYETVKTLLKCGYDVNFTTNNNFNFIGSTETVLTNVDAFKLIEDKLNYHFQNNYLETIAHICVSPLYNLQVPSYTLYVILEASNLNIQDIENNTVWHYIMNRPPEQYKQLNNVDKLELIKRLTKKCPPKTQLRNNYNQSIKNVSNQKGGQLKHISDIKAKRKIQQKLKKIPYAQNTVYKPDAVTRTCYLIHYLNNHDVSTTLVNKLPNFPMSFLNKQVLDLAKMIEVNTTIYTPLFYYELFWINANINYFPKALDVKSAFDKTKTNLVFWYLTTTTDGNDALHANIIILNKKEKYVIRFDPHGATNFLKHYSTGTQELDNALKEYFYIICPECKYVFPNEFNYKFGYQSISDEDNLALRKIGDPDGYCFAWCYWFLDLTINNQNKTPSELIDLGMETLMNSEYTILDQIRNYAMMMNKEREKILSKMKIDCKELYNIVFDEETLTKFKNGVKRSLFKKVF